MRHGKESGLCREHSCHRNRGSHDLPPCCDANHGARRGCSRGDLCAWLLWAMGHLSPLSLWRFLRVFRPYLWGRCGVLSLYASVLSTPAEQSRICDGPCDRWRRCPIRVLRDYSDSTAVDKSKPRGMPFRIFPYSFSSWPLPLDGVITWIATAFCTPPRAWSMELDIRRVM